jgi:ABC-type branched-subunit amino acid transport system substrate-binding protein
MKRFAFVFLLLFGLCLYPGLSSVTSAAGFERGQELYQLGRHDQALAVLRDHLRNAPETIQTARAYALIGRILTERQQYPEVILYLQRTPAVLRSPDIELFHGNALVAIGRVAEGLRMLQPLIGESLAAADQQRLFQALESAVIAQNQPLFALYYLHQELAISADQSAVLLRARQLLQSHLSDVDLAEAAFMWQGTEIGQDARLQLARRALARQNPQVAREQLDNLFAIGVPFPYWQEAEGLLQRTREDGWLNRNSVGVLLPLSGPYAPYGEMVKNGLELALKEHNKSRFPVRFIYRDTAGNVPVNRLVGGLANEDRVIGIIGPLLSADAMAAAREAQLQMVPMLALAQTEGLPQVGNFIFRDTITAEQQVKALVNYAMANQRISFSVLRPQTRGGQQMTQLFEAMVRRSGGELVDVISYVEGATDFREQVEQLLRLDRSRPISEQQSDGVQQPEYPPPPFHALFIPDFADNISLIAPQLMFYGLKDVLLLGINGWYSPELINRAGRFLDDAVFVEAFYAESRSPEVRGFVELFRSTYREEPSVLEAQAFDAASLLLATIDNSEVGSRDDLRAALLQLGNIRGVTGTRGFDLEGEALKELNLLGVQRGRLVERR